MTPGSSSVPEAASVLDRGEHGEDAVLGSLADTCAHGRSFQAELGGEDADERDDRDL
jgi:hypothetical protein